MSILPPAKFLLDRPSFRPVASLLTAMFWTGILLCLVCGPLVWHFSNEAGVDPLQMLILTESDVGISRILSKSALALLDARDLAQLSSLFFAYGIFGFIGAALGKIAETQGIVHIIHTANGFMIGIFFVLAWVAYEQHNAEILFKPNVPKFLYLYVIFLIGEISKKFIEKHTTMPYSYQFLIDGILSVPSVLIVYYGYEAGIQSILAGPIFLISVALGFVVSEWVLIRPISTLATSMEYFFRNEKTLELISRAFANGQYRKGFSRLWGIVRNQSSRGFRRRIDHLARLERKYSSNTKTELKLPSRDLFLPNALVLLTATFFVTFPIIAAIFWWAVLAK